MPLDIDNSKGEHVRDLYSTKDKWLRFAKSPQIKDISKQNEQILIRFLFDMKKGVNISKRNKKGPRSYRRVNDLRLQLRRLFMNQEKWSRE